LSEFDHDKNDQRMVPDGSPVPGPNGTTPGRPRQAAGAAAVTASWSRRSVGIFAGRAVIKPMLRRIAGLTGLEHYEDTRAPKSMYAAIDGHPGWYRDMNNDISIYYHSNTRQYQLENGSWWDPVDERSFTVSDTWYRANDDSGFYFYDNDGLYRHASLSPAGKWLTEHFATSRTSAVSLIRGYTVADKKLAWTMFEYWNLVHHDQEIQHEDVDLVPERREQDIAKAEELDRPAPITMPKFTGKSYRLQNRPSAGTAIALPNDTEVAEHVDYYWRGKSDEMGGDAAERKQEKHGYDPVSAYQFARRNSKRWFVQAGNPNHIIFHNFPQDSGVVHMAVWDWTTGQMVTYYDIDQTISEGVESYLRTRGMQ